MKILVTGGAGYIGSHTCVELLKKGHSVVIVDDLYNASKVVVDRIEKIAGKPVEFNEVNILDTEKFEKVFENHKFDVVIHFAGFKAVGESVEFPLKYYENNVYGTINLLKTMDKYNVKNIIFSSSATVYGIPKTVPLSENASLSTLNPYGTTKLMCESILADWQKANPDNGVVLLRYFNPIGSHKTGLLGEEPDGTPNNIMPYIVRVASGKYDHLTVHGDDYETPDGTCIRDYIHVVDLGKGHVKALDWIEKNRSVGIFNLGTGIGYSVLDIVKAFENATGKSIKYEVGPRRKGDAAVSYGDTKKANDILGWKAELGIEDMCRDSWNFVAKNPNGFEG